MKYIKQFIYRILSYLLPRSAAAGLTRWLSRDFAEEVEGSATDLFVEALLAGMDVALWLCRDYRRNIIGFKARYVIESDRGGVAATADFDGKYMHVYRQALSSPTVRIRFKDAAALRSFLLSEDQDILESVLADQVEVEGNLNYVYKLGYMAKNLQLRMKLS